MSSSFDLPELRSFAVGTEGPAGERVFYLQAVAEHQVVTLRLEKQQVALLADYLARVIASYELAFRMQMEASSVLELGNGEHEQLALPDFSTEEEAKNFLEVQKLFPGIHLSSLVGLKNKIERILTEKYKILSQAESLKDKFYDQDAESQADQTESKQSNN